MTLEHQRLLREIKKHHLENEGEFLSVRKLKAFAKERGIKLGTDKAGELIRTVKQEYSNRELETMAAYIGKPLEEIRQDIEDLAMTRSISTMTKDQLCIAVCHLAPFSYSEIKDYKRDELREIVVQRRTREKTDRFLNIMNM